jgi:hypothetical protein
MVFGSGGIDNKCGELIRKTKGRKKCDEPLKFVYLDDSDFDFGFSSDLVMRPHFDENVILSLAFYDQLLTCL